MQYSNIDLRMALSDASITNKALAKHLGVNNVTITRWLNKELNSADRAKILKAIAEIKEERASA